MDGGRARASLLFNHDRDRPHAGTFDATAASLAAVAPALDRALEQTGIRLLHSKTNVEQITNALTISKLREKEKA